MYRAALSHLVFAAETYAEYHTEHTDSLVTTDRTTVERLATHLLAASRRFGAYRLGQSLRLVEQTLGEE